MQEREFSEPPVPPSGNGSSAVEGFAPRHQPASITNKPAESNGDAEMREVAAERDEFSPEVYNQIAAFLLSPNQRRHTWVTCIIGNALLTSCMMSVWVDSPGIKHYREILCRAISQSLQVRQGPRVGSRRQMMKTMPQLRRDSSSSTWTLRHQNQAQKTSLSLIEKYTAPPSFNCSVMSVALECEAQKTSLSLTERSTATPFFTCSVLQTALDCLTIQAGDLQQGQAVLGASFPWLEEAPAEGRGMRLSVFGLVHDALDCLLTDASLEFCQGGQPLAPKIADERQRQVLLHTKLARCKTTTCISITGIACMHLVQLRLELFERVGSHVRWPVCCRCCTLCSRPWAAV